MTRRKKSNRRRRRGRLTFLYKWLSVLVICMAILLALILFFRVNSVKIIGEERYSEDEILSASGIALGDNLFLLNEFEVVDILKERLPYIEKVKINRDLPAELIIQVTECKQVVALKQADTLWLLSASGKLVDRMEAEGADISGIPLIDGCELLSPSLGSNMALATEYQTQEESLRVLLQALENRELLDQVQGIHMADISQITMDYAERFTVLMPYAADYDYMLRAVQAVIEKLETNETGIIDLMKEGEAYFRQKS